MDYERFKKLIEDGVDCYILNTGEFMGKKVTKENTFAALEAVVDGTAQFKPFGNIPGILGEYKDIYVDAADMDKNGNVSIADLTALIDYILLQ